MKRLFYQISAPFLFLLLCISILFVIVRNRDLKDNSKYTNFLDKWIANVEKSERK